MNEEFNNDVESFSNEIIESAAEKVLEAGGSRELANEISRTRDPKLLLAIGTLAFTLAGCRGDVRGSTQENNLQESNDPTTSEQIPMSAETESTVESYDENGDVPVGEFVYNTTPTLSSPPTETATKIPTVTSTPEPTATPTRIPESDIPSVRGYDIGDYLYDEETKTALSTLEVYTSKVENIEITDSGMKIDLLMDFYNIKKNVSIETDEFIYLEVDPKSLDTIMQITVNKDVDVSRLINSNREYDIFLTIKDIPRFKSDLIERFINGEIDLEFDLDLVVSGL